ncbi:MAG: hypothetical protein AAF702_47695 [Chloroflexota bacterium]
MIAQISNQTSLTIQHSASPKEAHQRFLDDVADWVRTCRAEYGPIPPSNVHDQGTYTTGWLPYIESIGDADALGFMTKLRDQIWHHFHDTGAWSNGYWKTGEVHHATEHFELFLTGLYTAAPEDGETIRQLIDAVEHMGNWVDGVEPWFDWESGLFRSMWLGTEEVRLDPGLEINLPDHFRCANLCLVAYKMTQDEKYLELPKVAIGLWADAINDSDTLPIGLAPQGPIYALSQDSDEAYRQFAGQAPELELLVDRAENFLASNGVNTFLTLWQLTQDEKFLQAAEKLLDILAGQLNDPTAGSAADVIRTYRRLTGRTRYDEAILHAADALGSTLIQALSIDPFPHREARPSGIGKRQDMPNWYEDNQPRQRSPILLATAAEIRQDDALLTQSLDLARTHFLLARRVYPNGRHHGCSARTVSAVARGHGRENNAGMVTGVLGPVGCLL